ncbi:MAG: pilin [Patescibacteria group bacterium]
MKKFGLIILVLGMILTSSGVALAENAPGVVLLEPLQNPVTLTSQGQFSGLTEYLGFVFPIAIGLAATLAALMIAIGGFKYILSSIPGVKEEGKKQITEAIWGLVLALAAYLILRSINPELVKLNFDLKPPQQVGQEASR